MRCPICNNDIKCGGLGNHLKKHNLTLNEFIKTQEYYKFYIKYKEVNKEAFKTRSPVCWQFYKKRFPEKTYDECVTLANAKKQEMADNVGKANTNRTQSIIAELGEAQYKKMCKEKAAKNKEIEIRNIMLKNNMTYEEASELFRFKREESSPRTKAYWIKRGYSEEEAAKMVVIHQKKQSMRSKLYWTSRGYSEKEAAKKVSDYQMQSSTKRKTTKTYWKRNKDADSENKRIIYNIFNNKVIDELVELGYIDIKYNIKNVESIIADNKKIEHILGSYNFFNEYKSKYYKAVDFFTGLNKPLVEFCGLPDEIYDLDHIYSRKEGFRNKIAPEIIGSVVNLRYIPASENRSKKSRCGMTKEELLTKYYEYINGGDKLITVVLKKKKIEDVIPGDYVKSFDIDNNKECIKRVTDIFRPAVKKEYQRIIEFSDGGKIINSKDHPILVKRGNNYEYKKFRDLLIGDIVLNETGTASITALKKESIDVEQFYDLEVAETHNFYAGINGVYCSHNSSNLTVPFYHYEVELFSQLGDPKGSHENRARHTDQTIILNKYFIEKALNNEYIYLFHMNEVGSKDPNLDLYTHLGNYEKFKELYEYYSKKVSNKHKKKINAYDLLTLFLRERMLDGRVYFVFADNFVNTSFKENLYMTNLCCLAGDTNIETSNGTKQLKDIKKGDLVLSYNQDTKKYEYKEVLAVALTNPEAEVFEIEYNGKVVICTGDHKFLTQRGYIEAQHLLESDTIVECSSHI